MVANNPTAKNNNPKASESTFLVFNNAQDIVGRYHLFNWLINRLEMDLGFSSAGFKIIEATTGTYVKQKIMAPIKAKLKVIAMGLNIFPSTPERDNIGMKTIKIIN
jgi:hypothetical protein